MFRYFQIVGNNFSLFFKSWDIISHDFPLFPTILQKIMGNYFPLFSVELGCIVDLVGVACRVGSAVCVCVRVCDTTGLMHAQSNVVHVLCGGRVVAVPAV